MKKGEYVVSTSRLFKFVETQIAARKINVSDDPENPIWQKPRINGEHGSDDPELARFTADEVEKANLRVISSTKSRVAASRGHYCGSIRRPEGGRSLHH